MASYVLRRCGPFAYLKSLVLEHALQARAYSGILALCIMAGKTPRTITADKRFLRK